MKLGSILKELSHKRFTGDDSVNVTGIEYDSRNIKPGNVFVAISGYSQDGNAYTKQAVENGAAVIVSSLDQGNMQGVSQVLVDNPRLALAAISAAFYGHPSDKLNIVGVTGTNGKTTVSYLVKSIFEENSVNTGLFGTIEYRIGKKVIPARTTTPQSRDLQEMLNELHLHNCNAAVMEVSSHALVQDRVEGIEFDAAVFTNLSRDHMDFHGTMEEYLDVKKKLFSGLGLKAGKQREKIAVVNNDDPVSTAIIEAAKVRVITYGIEKEAEVTASGLKLSTGGTVFALRDGINGTETKISLPIAGRFNVYNALAAAAVCIGQGISADCIRKGLENVRHIPGRFEIVDAGQSFTVVVDYAHTDDSLNRLLNSCRQLDPKRIITVFGCGGDRDRGKRPLMGAVAVNNSDYVIVTSDNPRSEEPAKIILDIETGIRKTGKDNYKVEADRHKAIEIAIGMAEKGDLVVIAGKGHEDYQIIGDRKIHFDDREVARELLKQVK